MRPCGALRNTILSIALLAPIVSARVGLGQIYSVTGLSSPGIDFIKAESISETGWIAGGANVGPYSVAVRYRNGVTNIIPQMGGFGNWANSVNNLGHVAGSASVIGSGDRAFVYKQGDVIDLDPFHMGSSYAEEINDRGQAVGRVWFNAMRPFIWQDGILQGLPTPTARGFATAINELGDVAGYTSTGASLLAARWHDGQYVDLGRLPGLEDSVASDINDLGQVVGYAGNSIVDSDRAVIWNPGSLPVAIPSLEETESQAAAINNRGWIVGFTRSSGQSRAFLHRDGMTYDLNSLIPADSGWVLTLATDINDQGWIVGSGRGPDGRTQAFLLVPEPSTVAMLLFACAAVRRIRRPRTNFKNSIDTLLPRQSV